MFELMITIYKFEFENLNCATKFDGGCSINDLYSTIKLPLFIFIYMFLIWYTP